MRASAFRRRIASPGRSVNRLGLVSDQQESPPAAANTPLRRPGPASTDAASPQLRHLRQRHTYSSHRLVIAVAIHQAVDMDLGGMDSVSPAGEVRDSQIGGRMLGQVGAERASLL